jgi:hypothetical protein
MAGMMHVKEIIVRIQPICGRRSTNHGDEDQQYVAHDLRCDQCHRNLKNGQKRQRIVTKWDMISIEITRPGFVRPGSIKWRGNVSGYRHSDLATNVQYTELDMLTSSLPKKSQDSQVRPPVAFACCHRGVRYVYTKALHRECMRCAPPRSPAVRRTAVLRWSPLTTSSLHVQQTTHRDGYIHWLEDPQPQERTTPGKERIRDAVAQARDPGIGVG